jgi:excisionase family DNA binding protein
MQSDQEYLNAVQAAKYLGVNRQRVYQLADAGRLGTRIAGYWIFTKAELDRFKTLPKPKGGRPKKADAGH